MWVRVPSGLFCCFDSVIFNKGQSSFVYPELVNCLIRLAVRTPRCGRGNPGSNPGLDIFLYISRFILEFNELYNRRGEFAESPSSSVGRAPAF